MRKLSKREADYFKQLMPYIVEVAKEEGKTPDTSEDLKRQVYKAHQRLEAFICEMHEGATDRAKLAREAITESVYNTIRQEEGC